MTLLEILRATSARLAWIADELDPVARDQALTDLEVDVAGWLSQYEERQNAQEAA